MVPPEESWSLFKLTHNSKKYIVRMNSWLWNVIPHTKYLYKVGIATPLNDPNKEGFPTNQENRELYELENKIIDKIEEESNSVFTGTITGGDMKEFVFYSSDIDAAKKIFDEVKSGIKNRELQISIKEDKNWDIFRQLCPQK